MILKRRTDFANAAASIRLAPSLRVPVTPANRELLRWLRAAELAAWEHGCFVPRTLCESKPMAEPAGCA
jgi:hypothetical protein